MLDLRIQAVGSGNACLSENMRFNRTANLGADISAPQDRPPAGDVEQAHQGGGNIGQRGGLEQAA